MRSGFNEARLIVHTATEERARVSLLEYVFDRACVCPVIFRTVFSAVKLFYHLFSCSEAGECV